MRWAFEHAQDLTCSASATHSRLRIQTTSGKSKDMNRLNFLPILICVLALFVGANARAGDQASKALQKVLDAQPTQVKARYGARHPAETLQFFRIKPGMTVIEALPGRGWYSQILIPYLGAEGQLIGADYAYDMFPKFGFFSEDFIAAKKTWSKDWTEKALTWHGADGAKIGAFAFGSMTADVDGKVDAVLLIRALHNLARFENDGGYLTTALAEIARAVKPGGYVGVVQHLAPDDAPDAWANGSNGYLKKSFVISKLEGVGLKLIAESDVNLNSADQPTTDDRVWRLPPSLATSRDNPELQKKYESIGESTRMTLLFQKSS